MSVDSNTDDCAICLSALTRGQPLLTLSCNHKFHVNCLATNIKAQFKECPLCRATIDTSLIQLFTTGDNNVQQQQQPRSRLLSSLIFNRSRRPEVASSREELVSAETKRVDILPNTNSSISTLVPQIMMTTTMEYGGQFSYQSSNIYGLVTLQAPSNGQFSRNEASSTTTRVPIDLVCVVDQSGSMNDGKMALLKETLIYIIEQLNPLDRLAIISFDTSALDKSNGLKSMNRQNQEILKHTIRNDLTANGGTYIGSGLTAGINLFINRSKKNPVSALLLLTDGQDYQFQNYSPLMQRLPEDVVCHTFGYGPDHSVNLLASLAEQGHHGSFTYIDQHEAVGPAFAAVLGGLLSCIAQDIRVKMEFNQGYHITHIHSKYPHEPNQLPSSNLTLILKDLNTDEQRNLVFQLHVPILHEKQPSPIIGHVSLTYIDLCNGRTINTSAVPFHLIRSDQISSDMLQINYTVDLQRNRVETANVLQQALGETNYTRSLALLKNQAEKLQTSLSGKDPFCQKLIEDLQRRYADEQDYRSSNQNAQMQHTSERATYSASLLSSTWMYQSPAQLSYINEYLTRKK